MVGLIVFGGSLLFASPNIAWYWLPFALLVVAGAAWVFGDRESASQTRSSESNPGTSADKEQALGTLKQQYAVGEIDDAEFENRLETLLENDSIADVENRIDVDSETASEAERAEAEPTKRSPHHRQSAIAVGSTITDDTE